MSQNAEKLKKDLNATTAKKLLVICVDRDNDIGEKTGIKTPVVGRDSCIEAAQRLALEQITNKENRVFFAGHAATGITSFDNTTYNSTAYTASLDLTSFASGIATWNGSWSPHINIRYG